MKLFDKIVYYIICGVLSLIIMFPLLLFAGVGVEGSVILALFIGLGLAVIIGNSIMGKNNSNRNSSTYTTYDDYSGRTSYKDYGRRTRYNDYKRRKELRDDDRYSKRKSNWDDNAYYDGYYDAMDDGEDGYGGGDYIPTPAYRKPLLKYKNPPKTYAEERARRNAEKSARYNRYEAAYDEGYEDGMDD